MKSEIIEINYDQFADVIKPDEWIGFARWLRDSPDQMIEIESLIHRLAEDATQEERDSWQEDGLDVGGLIQLLQEDNSDNEDAGENGIEEE